MPLVSSYDSQGRFFVQVEKGCYSNADAMEIIGKSNEDDDFVIEDEEEAAAAAAEEAKGKNQSDNVSTSGNNSNKNNRSSKAGSSLPDLSEDAVAIEMVGMGVDSPGKNKSRSGTSSNKKENSSPIKSASSGAKADDGIGNSGSDSLGKVVQTVKKSSTGESPSTSLKDTPDTIAFSPTKGSGNVGDVSNNFL